LFLKLLIHSGIVPVVALIAVDFTTVAVNTAVDPCSKSVAATSLGNN
jgi:hypothetical protein